MIAIDRSVILASSLNEPEARHPVAKPFRHASELYWKIIAACLLCQGLSQLGFSMGPAEYACVHERPTINLPKAHVNIIWRAKRPFTAFCLNKANL